MSRCGTYQGYNDEWILENTANYTSWRNMFNDYYKIFKFGTYTNFRNHIYHDLKITRTFTTEQNEWLKEHYPIMPLKDCTELFCKTFKIGRSIDTIRMQACKIGVKQSEKIRKENYKNAIRHNELPIGATVTRTNCYGNKTLWEKTPNGWIRQAHLVLGEIPKDKVVIHLDGDYTNNKIENLKLISPAISGIMTGNGFWSTNPELTTAGIAWCILYDLIKRGDKHVT